MIVTTSGETESAEKMLKSSGRLTACREARLMESRSVTYKKSFRFVAYFHKCHFSLATCSYACTDENLWLKASW